MADLASLFAMPLTLVVENVKENQKSNRTEACQKESNSENGSTKASEVDVPLATGEIKLNNDQREVGGNKTSSPKKKKKKKQNKRTQPVHAYIDYDKRTAEEAKLLESSQWMWNDASDSATRTHEPEPTSSSSREIISYEELMNPKIFRKNARWRGRPDQAGGQEKPSSNTAVVHGNSLQCVPQSTEAHTSPSIIESVIKTEPRPLCVASCELSSAGPEKKVHEYIDYDKKLVEDAEMHDPFARGWAEIAAAGNHDNGANSSSCQQRDIISYAELNCPKSSNNRSRGGARGRGQNFQPRGQQNLCNGGQGGAFNGNYVYYGPPNKIPRLMGPEFVPRNNFPILMPMMPPCSFIDPNVAATEKEEIFERPAPVVVPNARKPLSNKQKKKIEKSKFYKEKLRQQMEKDQDRMSTLKTLQCRFFSTGSCTKGDECPFSHDFVPLRKPELCKFYVMNVCEKGETCVYYHKDWPCKFFHVFRSCSQGDACRFSHQPLTDDTRPLLEKSLNDGVPNSAPAAKSPEFSQPINGQNTPPLNAIKVEPPMIKMEPLTIKMKHPTIKIEPPWISGESTFQSMENLSHTPTFNGQMPPTANDFAFDPIHQEPWNMKLKPVDLDKTHLPRLPSGVEFFNLQDPRVERFTLMGKPRDVSTFRDLNEPAVIPFDRDSCRGSEFLVSSSELKSLQSSFVCDGAETFSRNVFAPAPGTIADLPPDDCTATSTKVFSLSGSMSSQFSSGVGSSQSDELKMKTARHFSLPLTRHAARGTGNGRLVRNGTAGMVAMPTGPSDPALPHPPSFN